MVDNREAELVSVFVAPDETTGNIVVGLLESEGISAMLQQRRTAWGGQAALIGAVPSGCEWGDVMVFEQDAVTSRELIKAFQSESIEEEPRWTDTRYTEVSHRSCCGFMAAVSVGGMIWVFVSGYTPWLALCGVWALFSGLASRGYLKTTPVRFHEAIELYTRSFVPMGIAFLLGGASAKGWVGMPVAVFHILCITSAVMFVRGAATKIPEIQSPQV